MPSKEVIVQGINIRYQNLNTEDYICLTDIAKAKNPQHSGMVIINWLKNHSTIQYLGLWETLSNPDSKGHEFEAFENAAGRHSFYLSPQKWIETTNVIGIVSQSALSATRNRVLNTRFFYL